MPISIRYSETDMMGVVYHANYLLYFEDARADFLRKIGIPYEEIEREGLVSPVLSVSVNYGEPLRYGDNAFVRTRIVATGAMKTTYAYEVFKEGQDPDRDTPCCTGRSEHCLVDAKTFRPVSIKRTMPELYARYAEVMEPDD